MAEVGRRGERWTAPHPVIGTQDRDRILIRELLTRDLTDHDVSTLLAMPSPAEGRTILEVIQAAGQTARFEAPIRDYLSYLFHHPEILYRSNPWSSAADVALAVVLRDDAIDLVDFFMMQSPETYGHLTKNYLSKRVTRIQDYRQLRQRYPGNEIVEMW